MTDDAPVERDTTPEETPDFGHSSDYARRNGARSRRERRLSQAQKLRRAILLVIASIIPGAGLTFTRRRRLGLVMLAATILTIGAIAYIFISQGLIHGATQFLTKRGLLILFLLIVGGTFIALTSVALTYRETRGDVEHTRGRYAHKVIAFLACLAIVLPAAQAARYVAITKNAFDKMYVKRYTGRGGVAHGPSDGPDPWRNTPRVNILLLGSDAGADRYGQRTDSVTVASINTRTGDTVLMTIPRNLQNVPFPASNPLHTLWPTGFYCPQRQGNECMMDSVWMEAVNHKDLFDSDEENPGLDTTREVVSDIIGQPIDYSVIIDFSGFQQLVDAMGGVWVNVPGPEPGIPIGGKINPYTGQIVPGSITGYIKPGYQKLDGYHALWYSRSRVGNAAGDDDRARRQRCMINSLVSQTNPFTMVTKFPDIMDAASKNIKMDIQQDDLPAWATLVNTMKNGNMRSLNISSSVNHVHPDFDKIRALVKKAISTPHDRKAPTPGSGHKSPAPSPSSSSSSGTSSSSSTSTEPITNTADSC